MKDLYRPARDVCVSNKRGHAIGVEWNISDKIRPGRVPHPMESLKAGVERRLSAAREAHQGNAPGVNARMGAENLERSIDVQNEIETAEQGLVAVHLFKSTPREAVNGERRNTHGVELSRPIFDVWPKAVRAMLEHDRGQATKPLGDTKLTGNRRWFTIVIARKKLLIRER